MGPVGYFLEIMCRTYMKLQAIKNQPNVGKCTSPIYPKGHGYFKMTGIFEALPYIYIYIFFFPPKPCRSFCRKKVAQLARAAEVVKQHRGVGGWTVGHSHRLTVDG